MLSQFNRCKKVLFPVLFCCSLQSHSQPQFLLETCINMFTAEFMDKVVTIFYQCLGNVVRELMEAQKCRFVKESDELL